MSHKPNTRPTPADRKPSGIDAPRRRLLKLGAYVPPAVLGMMIVGGLPRDAMASGHEHQDHGHHGHGHHTVGSCAPAACAPCIDMEDHHLSLHERHRDFEKCEKAKRRHHGSDRHHG